MDWAAPVRTRNEPLGRSCDPWGGVGAVWGLRAGGALFPVGVFSLFPLFGKQIFPPALRARLLLLAFAASFHLGQRLEHPRGILEQQSFMDEIISSS